MPAAFFIPFFLSRRFPLPGGLQKPHTCSAPLLAVNRLKPKPETE